MTSPRDWQRPLVSGLGIVTGVVDDSEQPITISDPSVPPRPHGGTLTGVAIHSTGKQVLVTNLHVATGTFYNNVSARKEPHPLQSGAGLYQPTRLTANKVGEAPYTSEPFDLANPITADMVTFDLLKEVAAKSRLFGSTDRYVARGIKEPTKGMRLTILGATSGEQEVVVEAVGVRGRIEYQEFTGLIQFKAQSADPVPGDSGAPLFWYDAARDAYRLAAIQIGGGRGLGDRVGYAFRASIAESGLGIKFGKPAPVAKIVQ